MLISRSLTQERKLAKQVDCRNVYFPMLFCGHSVVFFLVVLFAVFVVSPVFPQDDSPDDLLYDRVIRKLVNDRKLKTNALNVSVKEAIVTVSGKVESETLRRRVEKVVKKIKGVKGVVNRVRARN